MKKLPLDEREASLSIIECVFVHDLVQVHRQSRGKSHHPGQ